MNDLSIFSFTLILYRQIYFKPSRAESNLFLNRGVGAILKIQKWLVKVNLEYNPTYFNFKVLP